MFLPFWPVALPPSLCDLHPARACHTAELPGAPTP